MQSTLDNNAATLPNGLYLHETHWRSHPPSPPSPLFPPKANKLKTTYLHSPSSKTQVPVLAGPSISTIARATVCASPSPPPRPTAPFHVGVTRTAVYLAWEDQPFPGAPPTSYEIEAKGDLRNNSVWTPVFPPRYETVTCQPVNIPKRVPGLGLRYRVRACNHGGWGGFSDESEVITTKPWLEDLGSKATARAMEALMRYDFIGRSWGSRGGECTHFHAMHSRSRITQARSAARCSASRKKRRTSLVFSLVV